MAETPQDPATRALRLAQAEPGRSWAERLTRAKHQLPPDCPFEPVGVDGGVSWLIDAKGQLRGLGPKDLTRNGISSLVGTQQQWLLDNFPRAKRSRNGVSDSFRPEAVADRILAACTVMGFWQPRQMIRGRGAWLGEDGDLVLHLGDQLWIKGRLVPVGRRADYIYQLGMAMPRPARDAAGTTAAAEVMARLESWSLRRGLLDRHLLLGWICAAMVGGALEFRPHIWWTGESGTGKSTLQLLVGSLFQTSGIVKVSDATAAGVWQALGYDSIPAALDEMESEADASRSQSIIKLMRQATTGGVVLRGGADHKGTEFTARSCFAASAVVIPPMLPQDRNRMIQLDVQKLRGGLKPFSIDSLAELGRDLLRRVADHFPRIQRELLPLWRESLMAAGWPRRGADLYGTALACADAVLHDATPRELVAQLVTALEPTRMSAAADEAPEWRRCLDYLAQSSPDPGKREQTAIGQMILTASGYGGGSELDGPDPRMRSDEEAERASRDEDARRASRQLMGLGLKVMSTYRPETPGIVRWLAVANSHPRLAMVFQGSHWAALPGVPGGWRQALERTTDAWTAPRTQRFGSAASRATMVPLDALLAGLVGSEDPGVRDYRRERYRPDEAAEAPQIVAAES